MKRLERLARRFPFSEDQIESLRTLAGRFNAARHRLLRAMGYRFDHWMRIEQRKHWHRVLGGLDLPRVSALEISPGRPHAWSDLGYADYTATRYPEFDLCRDVLPRTFDVIIADNVLEHVPDPAAAVANVWRMLAPGGTFLVATPFMVRVHSDGQDFHRWTERALRILLETAGFEPELVETFSWGNRKCVAANLDRWAPYGWYRDMRNEPDFPLTVWAVARKADVEGPEKT
ncbi:MAG: methyltransferase domain-containing protein [Hyphomicrobiales bacterium]|nr:methyltransferase domain-containing protein [Hyphomicrobiales bacterium]MCP5374388.1 methyltransferase domain-containing protein [Hyphomicrobiales bacterium]